MPDLSHQWSQDLVLSPSGSLGTAFGPALGLQRVLRRLLTNPGEYVFAPTYGAGLRAAVGRPANIPRIQAVIMAQMMQEAYVAPTPPPVVTVTSKNDGTVYAYVQYADATTGVTQTINFPVV